MNSSRLRWKIAIATLLFVAACGGDDAGDSAAPDETSADVRDSAPGTIEPESSSVPSSSGTPESAGEACRLLDDAFLAETFAGQTGTFGDPYQFSTGVGSPDGLMCTWNDGSTGLSLRLTLEDAASAETEDHTDRAYNIDVEPIVEPQDGPGEKAVLLVDQAVEDLGGGSFPYGYFFVDGDVAVFIETVGLDIGADGLRKLADEASARLASS